MLGNSSAGILEAPFLKLPVVNVGNRQKGRLHANNVQFVNHEIKAIRRAVEKALNNQNYLQEIEQETNLYGDGNSALKIADILAEIAIDEKLLIKEITY